MCVSLTFTRHHCYAPILLLRLRAFREKGEKEGSQGKNLSLVLVLVVFVGCFLSLFLSLCCFVHNDSVSIGSFLKNSFFCLPLSSFDLVETVILAVVLAVAVAVA